ncbi:hypothetical protein LTR04_006585 [Oleoguttula sp. CCFEE 6159]|nr:hypothetical protein LTR04_006585 [Oleoguttula sp. CCFEE 6159]
MRDFLNNQLHVLVYTAIHTLFSIYVRLRRVCHAIIDRVFAILYYHHRTPELIKKDVKGLSRLPQHLSVILDFNEDGHNGSGLEDLVNDVCEIAAWSASAGIPILSIYERTGVLKNYIPQTHRSICRTFQAYFGRHKPTLSLRAPHLPSFSPPSSPSAGSTPGHLSILLLSADDGRNTLVDLTKTLAEMSQRGKISPADISPELIDAEISESVVGEPDLLVLFGPDVELKGYPPWQIRLTEIFPEIYEQHKNAEAFDDGGRVGHRKAKWLANRQPKYTMWKAQGVSRFTGRSTPRITEIERSEIN